MKPCWWDDFVIVPLLEKIPSITEIENLEIPRAFQLLQSINRRSELQSSIDWYRTEENNIEKGSNLPQLTDSKGHTIPVVPCNQDAILEELLSED